MSKKVLIIILVLALLVFGFFMIKNFTGNVVKEGSKKEINLENNCECIEKEKVICPEGYELMDEKRLCAKVSEKCYTGELNVVSCEPFVQYSPMLLSCSKYDCGGEIWRVK
ncbi:hypothetical protein HYS72_03100 [Candidatus Pacearchaeota archaeon]|nr:hypothetical protein [Candidatus Pacearchaeota archaeon]